MEAPHLNEDELNEIYSWVDSIPLSRPKKNIARDFSDGLLLAEIVSQNIPGLVEMHNYSSANSRKQKQYNWETLNQKVFKKMGFQVSQSDIKDVIDCKPEVIERVLRFVKIHINMFLNNPDRQSPDRQQKFVQSKRTNRSNENQFKNNDQFQQQQDEIIWEKSQTIGELRETIEILELKIKKLEDLLTLKDNKIRSLQDTMAQNGLY